MNQIRAIICGYYGKGNAGDEALLLSLLQMLPPQVKAIALSGDPLQTTERYGIESGDRFSAISVLSALRQSDIFIWGGGSLMQDVTSIVSPLYYASLMYLAQKQGLKTIAWAQGIGPLKHHFTRWLTKKALQGCNAVSVRDNASAKLVSDWHIPVVIAPDPVWALEAKYSQIREQIPSNTVAVNLRSHTLLTPQRLYNLTQALIQFQQATNTHILLVPFQQSQDQAIADTIASQLTKSHQIISLEDPRELKGLFKGIKMTIGMRYHSLIMAAAEGSSCFALSYDPKVTRLMAQLNLPGYLLNELPDSPTMISNYWSEQYHKPNFLNTPQINSLVNDALLHQKILTETIFN